MMISKMMIMMMLTEMEKGITNYSNNIIKGERIENNLFYTKSIW